MVLVLLFMFCMNLFMESTGVQCKIFFIDLFSIDRSQVAPNTGYMPFYTISPRSKFHCRDLEPLIEFAGSMDSLIKRFHAGCMMASCFSFRDRDQVTCAHASHAVTCGHYQPFKSHPTLDIDPSEKLHNLSQSFMITETCGMHNL